MSRELIKMWIEDHQYFIDFRLKELRNTENPHEVIRFEDIRDEEVRNHVRLRMAMEWYREYSKGID